MIPAHHFVLHTLTTLASLYAQDASSPGRAANIRVDSDLVLINALVTDRQGRVITGLDASKFRLFEDGKEQIIQYCASEDVPASIGLVLDASGSVSGTLPLLRQAAIQFVRAANPADEYLLVEFRDHPQVTLRFTTNTDELVQRIGGIEAGGSTVLYDAIRLVVNEMRRAKNPRSAVLLISGGVDNHSRYTERETRKLLSEVEFPVYTINVYERPTSGNRFAIQRQDPGILETFSPPTGGRSFREVNPKRLISAVEMISSEIRQEYILGYVPSNRARDGRFRRVRVQIERLSGQKFKISHRQGYYAPAQ